MDISYEIYAAAVECGYDNCGIIEPEDVDGSAALLQKRMEEVPSSAGFYAGIQSNYEPVKVRYPWAKAIIVLTAEHGKYRYPAELRKRYAKAFFLSPEDGKTDAYDHVKFENWLTEMFRLSPVAINAPCVRKPVKAVPYVHHLL